MSTRTCQVAKSGEPCGDLGLWRPVLTLRPKGYTGTPVKAFLGLVVCESHKSQAELKHFLGEEGWNQIVAAMNAQGLALPDRDSTELTFEPAGASPDPEKFKK